MNKDQSSDYVNIIETQFKFPDLAYFSLVM